MSETPQTSELIESKLDSVLEQVAGLKELLAREGGGGQRTDGLVMLQSPVALYVLRNGIFAYASIQMRQITGCHEHELVGMSALSLVHPEDRARVGKEMRNLSRIGQGYVIEYRLLGPGARVKWVLDNACVASYEGSEAIVGNLVDITSHKQAQEQDSREQEKFRDLCESATEMIQCVSPDGKIMYVNRSWREELGYTEDELSRLSLYDIVPADHRSQWSEMLSRAEAGEALEDIESVILTKQGRRVPLEGTMSGRFVENKPVYIRGIFRDLSKRKGEKAKAEVVLREARDLNRRLQQSNKELEEFAYIASHDLQEPLRKISSFGEILQVTISDKLDSDQQENLGYIIDGAKRMQAILDDLLSYSRITTQAKPFRFVDANAIVTHELAANAKY